MSNFAKALVYWNEGYPIPLDLAVALMAEGYDVQALEDEYME